MGRCISRLPVEATLSARIGDSARSRCQAIVAFGVWRLAFDESKPVSPKRNVFGGSYREKLMI